MENCLPACERTLYQTTISYANYPSSDVMDTLSDIFHFTPEEIESNSLAVNVYFEDLSIVTSETSYSYSFSALLSDIGGQLGLFVGASVISMLEIGLLMLDIVKGMVCKGKWKKKLEQEIEQELHDYVVSVNYDSRGQEQKQ